MLIIKVFLTYPWKKTIASNMMTDNHFADGSNGHLMQNVLFRKHTDQIIAPKISLFFSPHQLC